MPAIYVGHANQVRIDVRFKPELFEKPRVRIKMGKSRLNSDGLRLYDPIETERPWMFELPVVVHQ